VASVAHLDVLPRSGGGTGSKAKLALVEALLTEQEARPCAVLTLRWLERHAGVERAVFAAVDHESGKLASLTGMGVSLAAVDSFTLDLADRTHPLVVALAGGEPVAFHDSQSLLRAFETPLGSTPFHAVPLGGAKDETRRGLLLLTGLDDGPSAPTTRYSPRSCRASTPASRGSGGGR